MRLISTALALCIVAAPALAQSRDHRATVRLLNDPAMQEGVAGLVGALADIVLDTRVGPAARYADPRDDIRADDTLGSIVRRRDPGFEARLHDRTRRAVAVAGVAANDALAMQDEIDRTAARLRAAVKPLAALAKQYNDDN